MIDWLKFRVPHLHEPIAAGHFVVINGSGEVERETPLSLQVEGSYSSNITVRSVGGSGDGLATHLEICGNPAKFLQGHNVFGPDNAVGLAHDAVLVICEKLGITLDDLSRRALQTGNYPVAWVDINYSFELGCQTDVQAWIRAAEFKARTRSGRPALKGTTLYFQKHSRRWAIKAYSKHLELTKAGKKHELPHQLQQSGLLEWTENILRLELRLLGMELKKLKILKMCQLTPGTVKRLFSDYMGKIVMSEQMRLNTKQMMDLPSRLRSTYVLWTEGHYMAEVLSRPTFYRHRKELLESFGIDISITVDRDQKASNVVPLVRVLEARPASVPAWAYEQNLIHQSAIGAN